MQSSVDKIPWGKLLSRKEVWAIIVSHFCHNWGVFILLTWMPSYYANVLGFDLASAGSAAVYPWLCMAIMANVGGWLADTAVQRGVDRTVVRKVMQTIGFMGPAFFLTQLQNITSPMHAVLCMCACQGMDAFSQSGLYSNHQVSLCALVFGHWSSTSVTCKASQNPFLAFLGLDVRSCGAFATSRRCTCPPHKVCVDTAHPLAWCTCLTSATSYRNPLDSSIPWHHH
jgi:hypothetical protein